MRLRHAVASVAVERTLRLKWRESFDNQSWAKLDSLADRLRSRRLRFQGGGWQLHVLYTILSTTASEDPTDERWEAQIAALQEWIRQYPLSPTPRIALADTYENFAWRARGKGFADTVTPDGWRLFGERMQKALGILKGAEKISRDDPEWYVSMLVASSDHSWNRAEADALVNKALRREPGYFYIARIQADYLQPKWHGMPGETEHFVASVADRIGGENGDATYFFVAEFLLTVANCDACAVKHVRGLSWTRIRDGYLAIERLYGTNSFEHNAMALMALQYGDDETARQAFQVIGDNWDKDVWGSKAAFDMTRRNVMALPNLRSVLPMRAPR